MSAAEAKKKKVPLRMCVACREMKPKAGLIRVVASEDGTLTHDATYKAGGRGAYVCNNSACIQKARKIRGFERALKANGDVCGALLDKMEGN